MYTYIILKENTEKKLNVFRFLFRSFEERGMVGLSEEKDSSILKKQINNFLSMHVSTEWQLIIVDGECVYSDNNPYNNTQICKFVNDIFEEKDEDYYYKRNMHINKPQHIILLSLRQALLISNEKNFTLYSDFYEHYISSCRFFVLNVEKQSLDENLLFRLMCTALILASNQWNDISFERQYLYQIEWEIDEKKAREYLGDLIVCHKKIQEMLNDKFYDEHEEDKRAFFEQIEPIVNLGESEKVLKFKKKFFPFFQKRQTDEILRWKKDNGVVIESIKKLMEFPVGRWEKEIAEEKREFLKDLNIVVSHRTELTKAARHELRKKKEKCAEEIFSMQINGNKKKELVKKLLAQEESMELSLSTRMTIQSFFRSLFEITGGMIMVIFVSVQIIKNKIPFFVIIFFSGLLLAIEGYLYRERIVKKKKMNRTVEKINADINKEDMNYNKILGKIILHKKYSLFEQMQEDLDKEREEEKKILEQHREKLTICEQNDQKLIWTMGITPDKQDNKKLIINFHDRPEKCEYYYYPFYATGYLSTIMDMGNCITLPFPFINKFRVSKSCLFEETKEETEIYDGKI